MRREIAAMRFLRAFLLAATAFAAAVQALATEVNVARPGGAYATIATADATACAQLCANDGLCMAWTQRAGACELKAVAPAPVTADGATSGLSPRAPAFARTVPLPVAEKPVESILASNEASPTAPPLIQLAADDSALLGGPVGGGETSLRPRLGSAP